MGVIDLAAKHGDHDQSTHGRGGGGSESIDEGHPLNPANIKEGQKVNVAGIAGRVIHAKNGQVSFTIKRGKYDQNNPREKLPKLKYVGEGENDISFSLRHSDWKEAVASGAIKSQDLPEDGFKAGARNSARDAANLLKIVELAERIRTLAIENGVELPDTDHPSKEDAVPTVSLDMQSASKSTAYGGSVKSISEYGFLGTAVLFGDQDHTDITPYRDYFTPDTDFWMKSWNVRPMIFDHGVIDFDTATMFERAAKSSEERDAAREFKAAMIDLDRDPRIGEWTKMSFDPMGLWVEGEADKARRYAAYVKQMADQGILRLSTDSAAHLVRREAQPNGSNRITRWPIIGVSQTSHAAEPRLSPVTAVKSFLSFLGVTPSGEFVSAITAGVEASAQSVKAQRIAQARLEVQRLKAQYK